MTFLRVFVTGVGSALAVPHLNGMMTGAVRDLGSLLMRYGWSAFYGGKCLHGLFSGYVAVQYRSSHRETRRQLKYEQETST